MVGSCKARSIPPALTHADLRRQDRRQGVIYYGIVDPLLRLLWRGHHVVVVHVRDLFHQSGHDGQL